MVILFILHLAWQLYDQVTTFTWKIHFIRMLFFNEIFVRFPFFHFQSLLKNYGLQIANFNVNNWSTTILVEWHIFFIHIKEEKFMLIYAPFLSTLWYHFYPAWRHKVVIKLPVFRFLHSCSVTEFISWKSEEIE